MFSAGVWFKMQDWKAEQQPVEQAAVNSYSWQWKTTDIKEQVMRLLIWSHLIGCWSILSGAIWAVLKCLRYRRPTKLPADKLFPYSRLPAVSYIGSKIGLVGTQLKGFIMSFVDKMLKSVPLKFLKGLKVISPSAIDELKVDQCKKWSMNYYYLHSHMTVVWSLIVHWVLNSFCCQSHNHERLIVLVAELANLLGIENMDQRQLRHDIRSIVCDPLVTDVQQQETVKCWSTFTEKYPDTFGVVMRRVFCLPNSNASTERVFSLLKAVHTPTRNSLSLDTLNAVLAQKGNKHTPLHKLDADACLKRECKRATMEYDLAHSLLWSRQSPSRPCYFVLISS